ncbi:hypothetical protein [Maribacter sp. 2304DJ31-5]|uniref:hypothetical protein n=1 Tax=Maribacter sp. 2304DJ31-5 TaxID=3386273 RepID=UPI0039BCAB16
MNPELFNVLGKIAGIAGLSIGLILVIFREIIRRKIFPNLTKEQGYKILRLIIIFVFIIAMSGIVAWTYTEHIRNTRSNPDGDSDTNSNLDQFVVHEKITTLDLRTMTYVSPDSMDIPTSFVRLHHLIDLKNVKGNHNILRLPYKTGGAHLDVRSLTHDSKLFESTDLNNDLRGNFKIEKVLEINLGKSNDVTIINEATYWNAFNKFPRYGLISNYQESPQTMSLIVQFPEKIPFPVFKVFKLESGERIISQEHFVFQDLENNTLKIMVRVEEPFVRDTYLIEWDYKPERNI